MVKIQDGNFPVNIMQVRDFSNCLTNYAKFTSNTTFFDYFDMINVF